MSNEFEKAALKRLKKRLEDMNLFIATLARDYQFSYLVLKKDAENQMLRRMAVRNFCAFVEGHIHLWKWMALSFYKAFGTGLETAEIALLREETYDLSENGQPSIRRQNLAISKNFKFTCKMFVEVYHCSYQPNFGREGWDSLLKVFDVRNRLMHPKESKGIEVSDAEVSLLHKANDWLRDISLGLSENWDVEKGAEGARSKKSIELN